MKKLILIPILFAVCGCALHSEKTNLKIGERYRTEKPKRERFKIEKPFPYAKEVEYETI